jgi:amino acid adenylation domain-containing protein
MLKSVAVNSHPTYESVAKWFAHQAALTPDALAIVDDRERLTYADLDARSREVAVSLQFAGVSSESVVGLRTSRSVAFVIGALGILKSGAAYLPLDPDLPRERQSFQLSDCGAHILATEEEGTGRITITDHLVTSSDGEGRHLAAAPSADAIAGPERLAYVIYTSGSTGAPKGVEVTQANLLNLIAWHQEAFAISPADRATQLAGLGFDATVWELWPYLTAGASVHFVPEDIRTDPMRLRDWLVTQEITIAFVPTPLTEMLLTLEWPLQVSLRALLTGADALHRYPPKHLPFQLVNNYGPTECTVVATSGIVPPTENCKLPPPIGRPIKNTSCYLLDEKLQEVATGEVGELYIGGAGVARRYRNRPDLTAERFISRPFGDGKPNRLYRTGDLAYLLSNGQLAFMGRADEQIKLSGYRIEPNEIVHALQRHPAIQSACVIAREDTSGAKKLVGYIVSKSGVRCTETELRQFLQQSLPSYMIPAVFVAMDRLPLTSNGKVDRSALPLPEESNVLRDGTHVAPRTPLEERLAAILSQFLGVGRISVEDNFFFLGGHSLMAAQLINRIRDCFSVELPLHTIFDAPTIATLSLEVEKALVAKLEAMSEEEAERLESTSAGAKEIAS